MFATISRASPYAVGSSSASGTTRDTSRPRSASAASNTRPVATHSIAWLMPTTRGRNHEDAASGTMPTRANTKPKRADSAAIRMSIGRVSVAPIPTAGPFTAAMTGLRSAANGRLATPPASRGNPPISWRSGPGGRTRSARSANVSGPPPRSAPAQNARPEPVTTTTRTASSASAASATAAKAYAAHVFERAAETVIQVHGGIGFTWEHDAQLYWRRAKVDRLLLGDEAEHLDAVARLAVGGALGA